MIERSHRVGSDGAKAPSAEASYRWCVALLAAMVQAGVRHAVISPGSRCTPLVLACDACSHLRVHVHPDERSAAFFALGLARMTGRPAVVVATSGSAPANWYPAVIEAFEDFQPLVLISADRPAELQACGANQTTDQARLFGVHVRAFMALPEADDSPSMLRYVHAVGRQAVDRSVWPIPGPVHLNVPLREPLVYSGEPLACAGQGIGGAASVPAFRQRPSVEVGTLPDAFSATPGVIVCGRGPFSRDFPPLVARLAACLDWPILADPLSGLRCGPHDRSRVLARYDAFLRRPAFSGAHRPATVLQFGAVPVSRSLYDYLQATPLGHHILVAPYAPWPDPWHRATQVVHGEAETLCESLLSVRPQPAPAGWCGAFVAEEARAAALLASSGSAPLEADVLSRLLQACPEDATVFVGNSLVIRDVDGFLGGRNRRLHFIGNRGASGIDGNVSTALGAAAAARGPVIALLGDLALCHDMNGLYASRGLSATLVVFNNGGGAIFGYLPQSRLESFERYWLTPPGVALEDVARLHGLRYRLLCDASAFLPALRDSLRSRGVDLIEVRVQRTESLQRHQRYWQLVAASGTDAAPKTPDTASANPTVNPHRRGAIGLGGEQRGPRRAHRRRVGPRDR